jgi:UDPglucose 6-dehydrogenase
VKELFNTIRGKKISVLGFAFKKDTGDTRCSASITLIKQFRDEGAQISIYDPKVKEHQYWLDLVNPQVPGDDEAGQSPPRFLFVREWAEC